MKTKISILLLMIAFAFGASAQSIGDYIDVVYLKDGSMVKGVIIEQVPGKSIKLKTADGSEFVYAIGDVAKFTREEINASSNSETSKDGKTCSASKVACASKSSCKDKAASCSSEKSCCATSKIFNGEYKKKDKGYFAEIGMLGNTSAYALRVTNGYKFGRFGYLGLAVGFENVELKYGERLPEISLNLVYAGDILNRKITPFYQIEAGYGFSLDRYGYNRGLLNNNNFDFGKGFGGFGKDDDDLFIDGESASTLNYGGPQGALVLGVKFHTQKKIYFKLGLDARITSNFSDVHYLDFNDFGQVSGSNKKQTFDINPGLGARFTIGF